MLMNGVHEEVVVLREYPGYETLSKTSGEPPKSSKKHDRIVGLTLAVVEVMGMIAAFIDDEVLILFCDCGGDDDANGIIEGWGDGMVLTTEEFVDWGTTRLTVFGVEVLGSGYTALMVVERTACWVEGDVEDDWLWRSDDVKERGLIMLIFSAEYPIVVGVERWCTSTCASLLII